MRRRFVLWLAVLALVGVGVAPAIGKGHSTNFRTHLKGANEVPAVDTNAQGQAIFRFTDDIDSLHYKLIVANIDNVRAAHIHCAPAGANGPVGVTLFMGGPVSTPGTLAEATIGAPDSGNGCGWGDLSDVRDAILSGNAYVNVHTNPGVPSGEIRGQIR